MKILFVGDGEETFHTIGNFFKKICPGSEITRSKPEFSHGQLQRNVELAEKREHILLTISNLEQYIEKELDFVPWSSRKNNWFGQTQE